MNFLAGVLLLLLDEEEAFYLLAVLLEELCAVPMDGGTAGTGNGNAAAQPSSDRAPLYYHSPSLSGAHIDSEVFIALLEEKLPRVAAQFQRMSFPLSPLTISWLLCLFVNTLPLETTLVVWDVLFSEGSKMLFRAALSIVKVHERAILAASDFEEMIVILKGCAAFQPSWTAPGEGSSDAPVLTPPAVDTAAFLRLCFDPLWLGSFPQSRINALRNHCARRHAVETASREGKMAARTARNAEDKRRAKSGGGAATTGGADSAAALAAVGAPPPPPSSSSPPLDASLAFALTARGDVDLADLRDSSARAGAGIIEQFYSPPPPASRTPPPPAHEEMGLGLGREEDYVAVQKDGTGGSPPEHPSAMALASAAAVGTDASGGAAAGADLAQASPPSSASRPARPPLGAVKSAIKRASLIGGSAEKAEAQGIGAAQEEGADTAHAQQHPPHRAARRLSTDAAIAAASSPSSVPSHRRMSTSSSPSPVSTPASPSAPSLFSSVLSSMGRALSDVASALSEDERACADRSRRELQQARDKRDSETRQQQEKQQQQHKHEQQQQHLHEHHQPHSHPHHPPHHGHQPHPHSLLSPSSAPRARSGSVTAGLLPAAVFQHAQVHVQPHAHTPSHAAAPAPASEARSSHAE